MNDILKEKKNYFQVGDKIIVSEVGLKRNSITKNKDQIGEIKSLPKNGWQVDVSWPGYKNSIRRPHTDFILYSHKEEIQQ